MLDYLRLQKMGKGRLVVAFFLRGMLMLFERRGCFGREETHLWHAPGGILFLASI
jgi:hypothetical protein